MDFNDILAEALAEIENLRARAAAELDRYTTEQPQWDAAFQIHQDLDRAYGELDRTRYAIVEGLI